MTNKVNSRLRWTRVWPTAILLLVVLGCTQKGGEPRGTETSTNNARTAIGFGQFSDIPVPAGSKMDVDRSLIIGARDNWIGRLAINTSKNSTKAYDFFVKEMPKFGWQEVTTVRSDVSILTFRKGKRIITVKIVRKTLGGSEVDVTASPAKDSGLPPNGPNAQ